MRLDKTLWRLVIVASRKIAGLYVARQPRICLDLQAMKISIRRRLWSTAVLCAPRAAAGRLLPAIYENHYGHFLK
eukprot:SAG31_NODE_1866_length_7025_cov_2.554017_8_plen_75_part_00